MVLRAFTVLSALLLAVAASDELYAADVRSEEPEGQASDLTRGPETELLLDTENEQAPDLSQPEREIETVQINAEESTTTRVDTHNEDTHTRDDDKSANVVDAEDQAAPLANPSTIDVQPMASTDVDEAAESSFQAPDHSEEEVFHSAQSTEGDAKASEEAVEPSEGGVKPSEEAEKPFEDQVEPPAASQSDEAALAASGEAKSTTTTPPDAQPVDNLEQQAAAASGVPPTPAAPTPTPLAGPVHVPQSIHCRMCGTTVANTLDHLPRVVFPVEGRVVGHVVEEALPGVPPGEGVTAEEVEGGLVHEVSLAGSTIEVALFSHVHHAPPGSTPHGTDAATFFPGYRQHAISCPKCSSMLGWEFTPIPHAQRHAAAGVSPSQPATTANLPVTSSAGIEDGDTDPRVLAAKAGLMETIRTRGPVHAPEWSLAEEERAFAMLRGKCVVLNRGYWNYEWCHGVGVRQFHVEQAPNGGGVQNPAWSMGNEMLERGAVTREVPPIIPGSFYFTSHFFRGGQMCHETGKGRATEVQFFCCSQTVHSDPIIDSVSEPATCKYVMRVCLPTLCVPLNPPAAQPASSEEDASDDEATASTGVQSGGDALAKEDSFYGLMWGAVLDGGNDIARELIAPSHYATGAANVRFS